jgi:hypothetical protein
MANVIVGAEYKHRTFCYLGNQVGLNTRYFTVSAITGGTVSESALATGIDAQLAPLYKPALCNLAQYIGSDIQNITGMTPYPIQIGTNANAGNGTGGSLPMPGQVSGIYTTYTGLTGKGYRGRSYIPFPSITHATTTAPSSPTSAYQALIQLIAASTVGVTTVGAGTGFVTLTWALRHVAPSSLAGTMTPITSALARPDWATQRRRGDYGRLNPVPVP